MCVALLVTGRILSHPWRTEQRPLPLRTQHPLAFYPAHCLMVQPAAEQPGNKVSFRPLFLSFFFFFINLSVFLIYISSVIPFPGFRANITLPHSPSLWVFPSQPSPHCRPPPNSLVHWGFSLSRTQGFPFHWCSY